MMNQLLRLSFITFIWKRYKALILSTLLLLVFFLVVALAHQDYSQYAQLNEDKQYLGLSFLLKWLLYGVGLAAYLYFNWGRDKPRAAAQGKDELPSGRKAADQNSPSEPQKADPFEHLRHKQTLKSKADQLIEKKPKKNN